MKILFVIRGLEIGGSENDVLALSHGLIERKHNITVLSGEGEFSDLLNRYGVNHVNLLPKTKNIFIHFLQSFLMIRKLLNDESFDVINPQSLPLAISCFLARLSLKKAKSTMIVTIHMLNTLKMYKFSWLLNFVTKKIIVESECEKKRLINGGTIASKIIVIHNCVDPSKFLENNDYEKELLLKKFSISNKNIVFGVIARLSPEKGHTILLQSFSNAIKVNPEIRLLVIGGGPLFEELIRYTNNLGLENHVIFTGPQLNVSTFLSLFDVFVLPSLIESLPLSIREAMFLGKPVIATDVGGIKEAVIDGVNGILINSNDVIDLENAILKMANSKDIREQMGIAGKELSDKKFNYFDWITTTESVFKNSINE